MWNQYCINAFLHFLLLKGYQWLKERVNSEEGRRQLVKIKELHLLADRLGCTAAQLAIGMSLENIMVVECRQWEGCLWCDWAVNHISQIYWSFLLLQHGVCAVRGSAQYFWEFLLLTSCLRTWVPFGYFLFSFISSHLNQCHTNNSAWATLSWTSGYAALLIEVIFKTNCPPSFLPRRFYPKWPLKP